MARTVSKHNHTKVIPKDTTYDCINSQRKWQLDRTISDSHSSRSVFAQLNENNKDEFHSFGMEDKEIKLWDINTGAFKSEFLLPTSTYCAFNTSCDPMIFMFHHSISFKNDQNEYIEIVHSPKIDVMKITWVSISKDGSKVCIIDKSQYVQVWNVLTRKLEFELRCFNRNVLSTCCDINLENNRLLTSDSTNIIRLWDVGPATLKNRIMGRQIRTYDSQKQGTNRLKFSSDCSKFVNTLFDRHLLVWNVKSGKLLATLIGHGNAPSCVAWSTDDNLIVSGSLDATVKVWNAHTGALIQTLVDTQLCTHLDKVMTVSISKSCNVIVTAGADNCIKVWRNNKVD